MSQLFEILQEPLTAGGRETRTILALLREKMDGVDHHYGRIRSTRRARSLKERLGLKGMSCCSGSTWGFRSATTTNATVNASDSEDEEIHQHHHQPQQQQQQQQPSSQQNVSDPACASPVPVNSSGNSMNLAAALAAERHFRTVEGTNMAVGSPNVNVGSNNDHNNNSNSNSSGGGGNSAGPTITAPGTPLRMSLMRLLAETDGEGEEDRAAMEAAVGGGGNDTVCCVCMVRKKGAAFIPCGHTFCRVCSREVWLNRGSCPLCNRSILEILDIF